jgi:hypothetical protein
MFDFTARAAEDQAKQAPSEIDADDFVDFLQNRNLGK